MTYLEFFRKCQMEGIPLADIRDVFSCFPYSFDSIGIHGEEEAPKEAEHILIQLKKGYPAAYIAGFTMARGVKIYLDESTLIPRNETLQFLEYLHQNKDFNGKKVLDLCTGSGVIALLLKKWYPEADIYASDISEQALTIAQKSANEAGLTITFLQSDFLKDIDDTFDILISNPPYIEEDSQDVDAPFEPKLALYSGKDGMDSYRSIFQDLHSHLKAGGEAYFELESTNADNTLELYRSIYPKQYKSELWIDGYGRKRYLITKK